MIQEESKLDLRLRLCAIVLGKERQERLIYNNHKWVFCPRASLVLSTSDAPNLHRIRVYIKLCDSLYEPSTFVLSITPGRGGLGKKKNVDHRVGDDD